MTAWRVGGHCGECAPCRRGDFVSCSNQPQPGTTEDGGYAETVYARATGLVRVPEELNPLEAALLLCAGVTTFNALRNADAPFGRWSPDWRFAANSSSWAGRPTRSPCRPPT